jgi:hypothetical protein
MLLTDLGLTIQHHAAQQVRDLVTLRVLAFTPQAGSVAVHQTIRLMLSCKDRLGCPAADEEDLVLNT